MAGETFFLVFKNENLLQSARLTKWLITFSLNSPAHSCSVLNFKGFCGNCVQSFPEIGYAKFKCALWTFKLSSALKNASIVEFLFFL